MNNSKEQAKWVRAFRWLHRKIAIASFLFFLILSISGLLLGLKKNTGLLAPTKKGISTDLITWLSIDSLHNRAVSIFRDSVSQKLSAEIDRIDIRPDKGIVKFIFKTAYWGIQLDGTTGALLLIEKRHSDLIEDIHDGSILDNLFGNDGEQLKASYTTIMGLSLFSLVASGFWLWYGPKMIRREKRSRPI